MCMQEMSLGVGWLLNVIAFRLGFVVIVVDVVVVSVRMIHFNFFDILFAEGKTEIESNCLFLSQQINLLIDF